ncbi:MAG: hypothetical protein KKC46_10430 [Proteobacteria bacterium]|nr:hypothetical protein [Pseudomonadota bacterium]
MKIKLKKITGRKIKKRFYKYIVLEEKEIEENYSLTPGIELHFKVGPDKNCWMLCFRKLFNKKTALIFFKTALPLEPLPLPTRIVKYYGLGVKVDTVASLVAEAIVKKR